MDDHNRGLAADIATHGWIVLRVEADGRGPGFAYTIGLAQQYDHPEVIMVGLRLDTAHHLLNDLGARVRSGERFAAGAEDHELLTGYPVTFRAVPNYQLPAYFGMALGYYGDTPFRALQMIYPDRERRWPWQADAPLAFRELQPVLADEPYPEWANEPLPPAG